MMVSIEPIAHVTLKMLIAADFARQQVATPSVVSALTECFAHDTAKFAGD
jgi:hypothetical protein